MSIKVNQASKNPVYFDIWDDFNFKMKMMRQQNDNSWYFPKLSRKKSPSKDPRQLELL